MIQKLWVSEFRNLSEGLWDFRGQTCVGICGKNGHGKSNFLEALYTLLYGKSYRKCQLEDMVPFYKKAISLGMDLGSSRVYLSWDPLRGKQVQVSGTHTEGVSLRKSIQISYFSSDIVRLLVESPDARRKELDRFCKRFMPESVPIYAKYESLLRQKNMALKQQNTKVARFFHNQLSDSAAELVDIRQKALKAISHTIAAYYPLFPAISGLSELSLSYVSTVLGETSFSECMKQMYDTRLSSELAAGFALYGPHRDDYDVLLSGRSMSRFYSRGVNKTVNILFRFATYALLKDTYGLPILLLDDVFSEMDAYNQRGVVSLLDAFPQLFVTSLEPNFELGIRKVYWHRIQDGVLEVL